MGNTWGDALKITIFGESHSAGIGVVIDGLPPGIAIDWDLVQKQMARRAPGTSELATSRNESDEPEILSGIFEEKTTGTPICAVIRNTDIRSKDYDRKVPRPGTADLTAHIKYQGHEDYRGGGSFSGRLTAPLTFAGSLARQVLASKGITIGAHISSIGVIADDSFEHISKELLETLSDSDFPVLNLDARKVMKMAILNAKEERDSVGGTITCAAIGLPAGIGSPFFHSLESDISAMMFSIPGVKGIEFGAGFEITTWEGSFANDEIVWNEDTFCTKTNHNGGINGGISNGMPILFRVAVKPTPSIGKKQMSVDFDSKEARELQITGRHDPCIVPRAVAVVEAAFALCLLDQIMSNGGML